MGAWGVSLNQHSKILSIDTEILERFQQCRQLTESLCENLSDADASVQSMEDASPAKWHLAHTSWFFETFILRDHVADYLLYNDDYPYLFNSYYEAEGARHMRHARGILTRPSLDDIMAYRAHVTNSIADNFNDLNEDVLALLELGIHHEQQHQELLLTDILHLFSCNPLYPALWPKDKTLAEPIHPIQWIEGQAGLQKIGIDVSPSSDFAFDCEGPRHDILLEPYALADRTITNAEWLQFIGDGGYTDAQYWLSDGWAWVNKDDIKAPLYWVQRDGIWYQFALDGLHEIDPNAPVSHISLYEADAFASWAADNIAGCEGVRLPTEGEWEALAQNYQSENGNQLDQAGPVKAIGQGFFGNVWEWTGSAFRPYPRFEAAKGAVGEYNGKFMSGQFVLKGGSCATPRGHIRSSYRNFFYPHQRWQFTGLRLAKYIG